MNQTGLLKMIDLMLFLLLTTLPYLVVSQSIQNLGVSCIASAQQCGPRGGIGDGAHPVSNPQSFITDAFIPTRPNTTRQLALGPAPIRLAASPLATAFCPPRRTIIIDSANGAQ